ncbi:MAG: alpha/beta hydrolase [Burkholderiales bacterium]|jgi:pimeloyl-ACP methyl ester carboxylesterase
MATIAIGNTRLQYSEHGIGQPLVLVHGSASDCRNWQQQKDDFAKHFRTIVYSRRFHWPNDPISEDTDYSMQQHVDDLASLITALDASPAHLVGHSYGAFLCLLLAIQQPALVRSLVMAEPPALTLFVSNSPKPGELLRLLLHRPRTAIAIIKLGATGISPATEAFRRGELEKGAEIFGNAVLGKGSYPHLPELRKSQIRDNLSNVRAEFLGSGFLPLSDTDVRALRVPTLLITGQNSVKVFHRLVDRLEELLPDTRRVEIANGSHAMQEDNSAAFNSAVLNFLGK